MIHSSKSKKKERHISRLAEHFLVSIANVEESVRVLVVIVERFHRCAQDRLFTVQTNVEEESMFGA